MKRLLLFIILTVISLTSLRSQETQKWSANIQYGADLMSRYVWRGLDLGGPSPSIQPNLGLKFGNEIHSFFVGAWGSYTFSPTANQELDLLVSYTCKGLITVCITDYFFPGLYSGKMNDYFNYSSDSTGHVYEGMICFNGTKKVPVTFMIATNFFGNDASRLKKINDTTYRKDGIQYSTYLEIGYKTNIRNIDLNAFIGGTVTDPKDEYGESGYYGNTGPGITNIGIRVSRSIPLTQHYSVGLQVSLIANPMQSKMYLVFGITL